MTGPTKGLQFGEQIIDIAAVPGEVIGVFRVKDLSREDEDTGSLQEQGVKLWPAGNAVLLYRPPST